MTGHGRGAPVGTGGLTTIAAGGIVLVALKLSNIINVGWFWVFVLPGLVAVAYIFGLMLAIGVGAMVVGLFGKDCDR